MQRRQKASSKRESRSRCASANLGVSHQSNGVRGGGDLPGVRLSLLNARVERKRP
jgi:hypothetical protein